MTDSFIPTKDIENWVRECAKIAQAQIWMK
jgi:hypothetical protein